MSDAALKSGNGRPQRAPTDWSGEAMQRRIRKRYSAERRFRLLGLGAVTISAGFLVLLLVIMLGNGLRGFTNAELRLDIDFAQSGLVIDRPALGGPDAQSALRAADFEGALRNAALAQYGEDGPKLFSGTARLVLRDLVGDDPAVLDGPTTVWLPASSALDQASKGNGTEAEEQRHAQLDGAGVVRTGLNWTFLVGSDATDPTSVGIWGAFKGSLLTMLVTLLLAFPVGVLSAVYLEEYAPRNRWTDIIEVSINNLAAVPSIIFGLLGLAIFLNVMHLPRSAPIVGGPDAGADDHAGDRHRLAQRDQGGAALDPRRGARVGASRVQVVFHHVLPLACRHPHRHHHRHGARTGRDRAAADDRHARLRRLAAGRLHRPASVLPVQIFLWSDEVERGFVEKTSAAIIVCSPSSSR
jgi:phosphate transport system permease protein